MIVHKLRLNGKDTFYESEAKAREAYAAEKAAKKDEYTPPPFPACCSTAYVDPGKQGVIDALNEHCK